MADTGKFCPIFCTKYAIRGNNLFADVYICLMQAAIFVRKEERDLLSLISIGIEFQRNDPSYTKLFRLLVVECWEAQS